MSKLNEAIGNILNEKVRIEHDRYMRSHGKKASGNGNWAFTTKRMGDPSKDEMVFVRGKLSDAGKEAAEKLGSDTVYVMESEEQLEEMKTYEVSLSNPWNKKVKVKARSEKEAKMRAVKAQGVSSAISKEKASDAKAVLVESKEQLDENKQDAKYLVDLNQGRAPGNFVLISDGVEDKRAKIMEVGLNSLSYIRSFGSDYHIISYEKSGNKDHIVVEKSSLKKAL